MDKQLFKKEFSKSFLENVEKLAQPYIDSFNWFVEEGWNLMAQSLPIVKIDENTKIWFESFKFDTDYVGPSPERCRMLSTTYQMKVFFNIALKHHSRTEIQTFEAYLPLMIKSDLCQLKNKTPIELARAREEAYEPGGYFIVKGNEKIMRLLIVQKRNYPLAIERSSWKNKGKGFTNYGVSIRCVAPDESFRTINLHYLENGTCYIRLRIMQKEFFIPAGIFLKALKRCTDREIYERLIHKNENDTFIADRVSMELNEIRKYNLHSHQQCVEFIGNIFFPIMENIDGDLFTAGKEFLKRYLFVHLTDNNDKFNLLIFMMEKLYSLIKGTIRSENPDSIMNHEVFLPAAAYTVIVKNELVNILNKAKGMFKKMMQYENKRQTLSAEEVLMESLKKYVVPQFEKSVSSFFATGSMPNYKDMDLPQTMGLVIMLDRISFLRTVAIFRGVHRGAFFAESKMTSVRKLMPENWGFLCPVHTPDGPPCGILNHLTAKCKVTVNKVNTNQKLPLLLNSLGMSSISEGILPATFIPVVLDGKIMGGVSEDIIDSFVNELRILKVNGMRGVPQDMEFCLIKPGLKLFPILVIWTTSCRFTRPVLNVELNKMEWIGPFEQVFLDIACLESDLCYSTAKYRELAPGSILSYVASFTPLSDFNQSPRNMYQCQMAKQTLAFPCQNYYNRWDTKLYVLSTPQFPIVRTQAHNDLGLDIYPSGTNCMVAVISYTGYDMEDAMIINKGSYERGFKRAFVYKSYKVDLLVGYEKFPKKPYFKGLSREAIERGKWEKEYKNALLLNLMEDGLSEPGIRLENGMPWYSYFDPKASDKDENIVIVNWKGEPATIDQVVILDSSTHGPSSVIFKSRIDRTPVLGDKFASRSGQKGTLAMLYPQEDMPFTETGMTPDLIINPHAFPSRMTIGMLIESMAGKSGALHGMFQNGSPFQFSEDYRAVDFFGEQLRKAGYNYYGNEPLYSGILGTELHADIYIGNVYYQRLRHMVLDKWQVRGGTGPMDPIVSQPVGGRKRGGGVRFGEMERDSLIAHGSSFILKDRLMNSSDRLTAKICLLCGSVVTPLRSKESIMGDEDSKWTCKICDKKVHVKNIHIPGSYMYLIAELASLNIRVNFNVKSITSY